METNLVDILKGYVTPDVISKASTMLGESESGVYKGVSASIPTLLSGLVHKSNDSSTMESVMNLINENSSNYDNVLSNLPSLLTGYGNSTALDSGSKLMALLFKNKQSDTTDVIARTSGIKDSSAASLLGMAAPMLLSYFAKSGMTLSSLKSLLSSQKENILSAAPSGLNLGFGSTIDNDIRGKIHDVRKAESSSAKWLIPLLLVGAGLFALFFFSKGCNRKEALPAVATETVDTLTTKTEEVVEEPKDALGNFFKFKLPNGIELNAPEFGIENKLNTWLMDETKVVDKTTWFNFDRLLFDTGKATLRPESQEQLKNMVEILKAYPTVELKLGGYTDNVGDPAFNLKLSGDRAKSVMDEMIKMGIAKDRLESEGYGELFPVASNDTEEGKAQNRRIAVRVTKK
ncbi:OmpA family protein [Flavobacterium sinopsychrotolerans]|uniref:Outer membrane protein OmpA n=1 Tax=Flavobacterium sinopsychrotolerans TaxID=604089 RepID=A0A1H8NUQ1_9FLAO|nr:OmpA family protein [Flavobacterium sinopsychrotolerans]SEO33331.1 Outer membrane protein OmpA [Flavobacterium sinopsychrotolerans]